MIRAWTAIIISLVLLFALAVIGCGDQAPDSTVVEETKTSQLRYARFRPMVEQRLQRVLKSYWETQGPPGAILMVQQGNTTRWSGAIGSAVLGTPIPRVGTIGDKAMRSTDLMRVSGVVSLFNATLLLQMENEGLLSLEETVALYLPRFPHGEQIPLYRLLNHTSGLSNYTWVLRRDFADYTPLSAQQLIQISTNLGLNSLPGDRFCPCDVGNVVVARVIESITQKPYHEVLRERILTPYGLRRTFVEGAEVRDESIPKGYGLSDDKLLRDLTGDYHPSVFSHGNGIVSSAADLTSFMRQLQSGGILPAATMQKMVSRYNVRVSDTFLEKYGMDPATTVVEAGLGLFVVKRGQETFYWNLGTDLRGHNTCVTYRPRDKMTMVAFVNAYETCANVLGQPAWSVFGRLDSTRIWPARIEDRAMQTSLHSVEIQ